MTLRYGELFAGAGGLSMGLEAAGWECAFHAEIDEFARRVLKKHWPNVPLYGDVTQLTGEQLLRECGEIDLLSGGAPCQDLSLAGKRAGLDGARSGLFFDLIRLWRETNAEYCLYENVVGALSSNQGADFARVLSAFVGADVAQPLDAKGRVVKWANAGVVCGPEGVAAWRVFDAQYWGVAQRRRRVFVLGSASGIVDPAEVLLEFEGLPWDLAPSGAAGEGAAADPRGGADEGGRGRRHHVFTGDGRLADPIGANESRTYTNEGTNNFRLHNVVAEDKSVLALNARNEQVDEDVAGTIQAKKTGGWSLNYQPTIVVFDSKQSGESHEGVAPTLRSMQFDESHMNGGGQLAVVSGGAVAFQERGRPDGRNVEHQDDLAYALTAPNGGARRQEKNIVAFDTVQITSKTNRSSVDPEKPAPTLNSQGLVHVAPVPPEYLRILRSDEYVADDKASTIAARDYKSATGLVVHVGRPRRLLPYECELLMAWLPRVHGARLSLCSQGSHEFAVSAEPLSPSGRKYACGADVDASAKPVASVVSNFDALRRDYARPVALSVLLDSVRGLVEIRNDQGTLLSGVSAADPSDLFVSRAAVENFVRAVVRICTDAESATMLGEEGSRMNKTDSSPLLNGRRYAGASGPETDAPASGVLKFTETDRQSITFTTSERGQSIRCSDPSWVTSCCCVLNAIAGFIPKVTPLESSFSIECWLVQGHTDVPNDKGKPASDAQRYRAIGNGVVSTIPRWIGERLAAAHEALLAASARVSIRDVQTSEERLGAWRDAMADLNAPSRYVHDGDQDRNQLKN